MRADIAGLTLRLRSGFAAELERQHSSFDGLRTNGSVASDRVAHTTGCVITIGGGHEGFLR